MASALRCTEAQQGAQAHGQVPEATFWGGRCRQRSAVFCSVFAKSTAGVAPVHVPADLRADLGGKLAIPGIPTAARTARDRVIDISFLWADSECSHLS